jgi:hypothetical protein
MGPSPARDGTVATQTLQRWVPQVSRFRDLGFGANTRGVSNAVGNAHKESWLLRVHEGDVVKLNFSQPAVSRSKASRRSRKTWDPWHLAIRPDK